MKKTAVLLYNTFCNFELSVALEVLSLTEKPITIFASTLESIKSEEGLSVIPDANINEIDIEQYDSLLLPGAMDIRDAIENKEIIQFIQKFHDKPIGAISIAPILLVRAGLLSGKPFMAGINQEELKAEGFSDEELHLMIGWDDNLRNPVKEGYILSDQIITSVSYEFVKWGLAFGKILGLDISPKTFGL